MPNSQNSTYENGFYYSEYADSLRYIRNGNVMPMSRAVDVHTCLNQFELFYSFNVNSIFATNLKPLLLTEAKDGIPLGKQFPELFI